MVHQCQFATAGTNVAAISDVDRFLPQDVTRLRFDRYGQANVKFLQTLLGKLCGFTCQRFQLSLVLPQDLVALLTRDATVNEVDTIRTERDRLKVDALSLIRPQVFTGARIDGEDCVCSGSSRVAATTELSRDDLAGRCGSKGGHPDKRCSPTDAFRD